MILQPERDERGRAGHGGDFDSPAGVEAAEAGGRSSEDAFRDGDRKVLRGGGEAGEEAVCRQVRAAYFEQYSRHL